MFRGSDSPSRLQPRLQSARIPLPGHRRLNENMAKKRVHELAKQYDMPTSEVIKRLNACWPRGEGRRNRRGREARRRRVDWQAQAQSDREQRRRQEAGCAGLQQRAGFGHGTARAPRAENLAPKTPPKPKAKPKPKPEAGTNGAGGAGRVGLVRVGPRVPRCKASALPAPPAASAGSSSTPRPRVAARAVPAAQVAAPVAVPRIARRGDAAAGAGVAPTKSPSRRTSPR